MLNSRKRAADSSSGFTIIEVMIVLAIAALILLIVLLAVPALQRSSRNTQRRNDVGNILSGISQYVGDNGGQLPTADCSGTASGEYGTVCAFMSDINLGYYQPVNVSYTYSPVSLATAPTAPSQFDTNATDDVEIYNGATCKSPSTATSDNSTSGNDAAFADVVGDQGSTRSIVALFAVESGGGKVIVTCESS